MPSAMVPPPPSCPGWLELWGPLCCWVGVPGPRVWSEHWTGEAARSGVRRRPESTIRKQCCSPGHCAPCEGRSGWCAHHLTCVPSPVSRMACLVRGRGFPSPLILNLTGRGKDPGDKDSWLQMTLRSRAPHPEGRGAGVVLGIPGTAMPGVGWGCSHFPKAG